MAQDIFQTFDLDLQRLLVAGSGSASGDDGLFRAKDGFDKLAARVPALATASAQVSKVLEAKGRAAASELLALAVINLKLRAAQAKAAAVEGELTPLPPAAPLETPTSQHDLESLHRALTSGVTLAGRKIKRVAVVRDAIERGVFRDLRLLPLWVQAMSDSTIGDLVADKVIPQLGEAAATYLEAQFNPQGKSADARRLAGLVAIRGKAALPLVERCLQPPAKPVETPDEAAPAVKGKKTTAAKAPARKAPREVSTEVRAAAVHALETVDPENAEARARALYATEKSQEVREACIEVLGMGRSTESLELLMAALDDTGDVTRAAKSALKRFGHPQTTERLLALITPELMALKPYKAPRAKAGAKLTKAAQQAADKAEQKIANAIEEQATYLGHVIEVLGSRPSPAVIDRLIALYRDHAIDSVRSEAGEALKATRDKRALGVLAERLVDPDGSVNDLGVWAFFHVDPGTVFERMKPHLTDAALKTKSGLALADTLIEAVSGEGYILYGDDTDEDESSDESEETETEDSSEGESAAEEEDDPDDEYRDEEREAARLLAAYPFRKDPRWVDVALRFLTHKTMSDDALIILGHLKDRRAVAPLLEMLRQGRDDSGLARALAACGDAATEKAVIDLLKGKKVSSEVYSFLERTHPAAAVEPLLARLAEPTSPWGLLIDPLIRIGDPRAAAPIAQLLTRKDPYESPYHVLRALRKLDSVDAVPALKAAQAKSAKSKQSWRTSQFEELITYLERSRS